MDSVPNVRLLMRFFAAACLFGLLIGSVGCVTNNWSVPLFSKNEATEKTERQPSIFETLLGEPFATKSGIDPRAREIEERLGY